LLHSELNEDNGKCIYQDLNHWKSKGHGATNDIDVTGAYPHITVAENVSNKTTQVEVCAIEGLDRIEFRRFGVNYASSPEANATELAKVLYGMPEITEIRDYYVNIILPAVNDDSKEEEKKAA
jgi:hypothetical protein